MFLISQKTLDKIRQELNEAYRHIGKAQNALYVGLDDIGAAIGKILDASSHPESSQVEAEATRPVSSTTWIDSHHQSNEDAAPAPSENPSHLELELVEAFLAGHHLPENEEIRRSLHRLFLDLAEALHQSGGHSVCD